ncbi:hypothetical protein Q7P35_004822 [Cladosporium inversicolor]
MASKKRDLPSLGKSAPGDALYDSLEDFVLDQSEGEESGGDAERSEKSGGGNVEQSKMGNDDGGKEQATGLSGTRNHTEGDNTNNRTSAPLATTQRKRRRRVAYTAHEDIVLYLLHNHVSLQHSDRTEIFNRVLPDQLVVREKGALIMQWLRFKDDYKKKFANLSTAELAEHEAWKKKIDQAIKDAGMKSQSGDKQDGGKQVSEKQDDAKQGDGKQDDAKQDDGKQDDDKQDEDSDSGDESGSSDDSDSGDDPLAALRAYLASQREARPRYTADEEVVLYLLFSRANLNHDTRAKVFNSVFRDEGIVRNKAALSKIGDDGRFFFRTNATSSSTRWIWLCAKLGS